MPTRMGRAAPPAPTPPAPAAAPARASARAPVPARAAPIVLTAPWPDPKEPDAEPLTHLEWAERVARQIAVSTAFGFGWRSQEADDLVAVAHLTLVRLAPRFDASLVAAGSSADQLFRGWLHVWIKGECEREGERLRNGGWYWTTGDPELKRHARGGRDLPPDARCPSCSDVFFGRAGEAEGEEVEEDLAPVRTDFEPRLQITRNGVAVEG